MPDSKPGESVVADKFTFGGYWRGGKTYDESSNNPKVLYGPKLLASSYETMV